MRGGGKKAGQPGREVPMARRGHTGLEPEIQQLLGPKTKRLGTGKNGGGGWQKEEEPF